LNALPQFTTEIDGAGIHFIHVRSPHENALLPRPARLRLMLSLPAGFTTFPGEDLADTAQLGRNVVPRCPLLQRGRQGRALRGAEVRETLARRLPGLAVAGERVERVSGVGDLSATVRTLRRSEQGRARAGACSGLGAGDDRGPVRDAGAVARAHPVLVLLEQIE